MNEFVKEFKDPGPVVVNLETVIRKWNRLWFISQWGDDYTLVKQMRKDSPITTLKVRMDSKQTETLIAILDLERTQSGIFRSGATWKKKEQSE